MNHRQFDIFIWLGIRNSAFGLAHWMYAVDFWFSSIKLKYLVEHERLYERKYFEAGVFCIGFVLNASVPLLTCFTDLLNL